MCISQDSLSDAAVTHNLKVSVPGTKPHFKFMQSLGDPGYCPEELLSIFNSPDFLLFQREVSPLILQQEKSARTSHIVK